MTNCDKCKRLRELDDMVLTDMSDIDWGDHTLYDNLCSECWAILSHVEGLDICGACDCVDQHGDAMRRARIKRGDPVCGYDGCHALRVAEDTITGRYWCEIHAPSDYPDIGWDENLETDYIAYVYGPEGADPGLCRIRVGCDDWMRWWLEDGDRDVSESYGPYASLADAQAKQAALLAKYKKEEAWWKRPVCAHAGCNKKATTEDGDGDPCCEAHSSEGT